MDTPTPNTHRTGGSRLSSRALAYSADASQGSPTADAKRAPLLYGSTGMCQHVRHYGDK